jgi:hypothetical protein
MLGAANAKKAERDPASNSQTHFKRIHYIEDYRETVNIYLYIYMSLYIYINLHDDISAVHWRLVCWSRPEYTYLQKLVRSTEYSE